MLFCAIHDQLTSPDRHVQLTHCFSAVVELLVMVSCTVGYDVRNRSLDVLTITAHIPCRFRHNLNHHKLHISFYKFLLQNAVKYVSN